MFLPKPSAPGLLPCRRDVDGRARFDPVTSTTPARFRGMPLPDFGGDSPWQGRRGVGSFERIGVWPTT